MKVRIDRETDALYMRFDDSRVIDSEQVAPGVIVDFDSRDRVVGVEVLNVSRRGPRRTRPSNRTRPVTLVREKPVRKHAK